MWDLFLNTVDGEAGGTYREGRGHYGEDRGHLQGRTRVRRWLEACSSQCIVYRRIIIVVVGGGGDYG